MAAFGIWTPVSKGLPEDDFQRELEINGECPSYIVTIEGAVTSTILQFDGECWWDENGNTYRVTAWMPLPPIYRER